MTMMKNQISKDMNQACGSVWRGQAAAHVVTRENPWSNLTSDTFRDGLG